MKKSIVKPIVGAFVLTALALSSCKSGFYVSGSSGVAMPITAVYDAKQHGGTHAIVSAYRQKVDSIMSPVIGHSAGNYSRYRPESPMSNLMADVLFVSAEQKSGQSVDVAIMNMGGIRSDLSKGAITYGDIFEIAPFENCLCVATMKGEVLKELFEQVAMVGGEGLSGARMQMSKDGKLLSVEVNGQPIDPQKTYRVATIDYLAAGNDKMLAFLKSEKKEFPGKITLRDLFFEYVRALEQQGKPVTAAIEGRIVVL